MEALMNLGFRLLLPLVLACGLSSASVAQESDDPELVFKKTTVWRFFSPDAKLATYALDDPGIEGVACHFTVPEIGGWSGWAGFAEERSETSLACRQIGPVKFKAKFEQGEEVYRQRRSLFFKKMQIVRGCDAKRNVLVYLSYTDKLIEGSPQNSTSTVPIMPWGTLPAPKCGDFLTQ
jgi:CreA protein